MRLAPLGSGGVTAGSVAFPPLDLAALWSAGNWLKSQGGALSGSASRFSGAAKQVSDWTGKGADAWHGDVQTNHSAINEAASRLNSAGGVLSGLCSVLESAQGAYQQAATAEATVRQRMAQRQAAMAALLAAPPPPPGSLPPASLALDPLGGYFDQEELSQAIGAEQQAVGQVHAAAHAAAGKLVGLADKLPRLTHQGSVGGPPGPSHFLALLLGSLIGDNYLKGRANQEELNEQLGLNENTQSYTVQIRTRTGSLRNVTVKPDRMGETQTGEPGPQIVAEDKSSGYQYNSTQLKGEMELAKQEDMPFQLTVGPKTRISGPAQRALDGLGKAPSQGDVPPVLRYQGNGIATNEAGTQEYVANPDTHIFEPVQAAAPGTALQDPTRLPVIDDPLPDPDPVDPVEPGIGIDPLP